MGKGPARSKLDLCNTYVKGVTAFLVAVVLAISATKQWNNYLAETPTMGAVGLRVQYDKGLERVLSEHSDCIHSLGVLADIGSIMEDEGMTLHDAYAKSIDGCSWDEVGAALASPDDVGRDDNETASQTNHETSCVCNLLTDLNLLRKRVKSYASPLLLMLPGSSSPSLDMDTMEDHKQELKNGLKRWDCHALQQTRRLNAWAVWLVQTIGGWAIGKVLDYGWSWVTNYLRKRRRGRKGRKLDAQASADASADFDPVALRIYRGIKSVLQENLTAAEESANLEPLFAEVDGDLDIFSVLLETLSLAVYKFEDGVHASADREKYFELQTALHGIRDSQTASAECAWEKVNDMFAWREGSLERFYTSTSGGLVKTAPGCLQMFCDTMLVLLASVMPLMALSALRLMARSSTESESELDYYPNSQEDSSIGLGATTPASETKSAVATSEKPKTSIHYVDV